MKKAILYIRVSTDEQSKNYSPKHQEEFLRRYCDFNNITIVELVFEDYSAKTFNRPAFQTMLQKLKRRSLKADFLIFTKWDRFSRNAPDAYGMISTLNKIGIEPQAVEQPLDLTIPENKIMLAFYLSAPEVENDRRSLNTIGGMRRAKKEGRWVSTAPRGYDNIVISKDNKYIAPNKDAPTIKWAFEILVKGQHSVEEVRRMCIEKGVHFTRNRFNLIIKNPVYCGRIILPAFKKEESQIIMGTHETIISEELFDEVQDVLMGRRRKQTYKVCAQDEFPLRGFLVCPRCGNKLTGSASTGGSGIKHHYYHCTKGCKERVKSTIVNNAFSEFISKISFKKPVQELYDLILKEVFKSKAGEKTNNQNVIKLEIEKYKERLNKAQELMLDGQMEMDEYKEIKRTIEPKIDALLNQQIAHNAVETDYKAYLKKGLTAIANLGHLFDNTGIAGKQEIIRSTLRENAMFSDGAVRTEKLNKLILLTWAFVGQHKGSKIEKESNFCSLSPMVAGDGFEPTTFGL